MKGCLQSTSIIMTSWPAGDALDQWSVKPAPGWMAREARGRRHSLVLERERTKLLQDVCCNIVVVDDVVELETVELVLELADF
jgi:hypothetical protein